jgi:hypothetical protein
MNFIILRTYAVGIGTARAPEAGSASGRAEVTFCALILAASLPKSKQKKKPSLLPQAKHARYGLSTTPTA